MKRILSVVALGACLTMSSVYANEAKSDAKVEVTKK
jgi:hypothetical protein